MLKGINTWHHNNRFNTMSLLPCPSHVQLLRDMSSLKHINTLWFLVSHFIQGDIYFPSCFLISVDDKSTRNLSSGIEMNISLNSSGISKSSRTWQGNYTTDRINNFRKERWNGWMVSNDRKAYLENTMYITATHKKSGPCFLASKKYLQHLLVVPVIVLRL